ncbi:MAG: phosphatidylserine/phosphatidylglycerophosphate/cardiolipin synthase family protein [Halodesulfurarchaeum sp.]
MPPDYCLQISRVESPDGLEAPSTPEPETLHTRIGPPKFVLAHIGLVALLATTGNVTVQAVYPNPTAPGDAGEYVLLHVEGNHSLEGYALGDGEDRMPLPGVNVSGPVLVTGGPPIPGLATGRTLLRLEPFLELSNGGERVNLTVGNRTVDSLAYTSAPEAERFDGRRWEPPGRSSFDPVSVGDVNTTVFALPDSDAPVENLLQAADRRLLLAGYTFVGEEYTDTLLDQHRRGVPVQVLLDAGPVGGITSPEVRSIDTLAANGIRVRMLGGPRARYNFHHAKYLVVDDVAMITSENWKPGGVGGHGSRGWAVVIRNETIADYLARVFQVDSSWHDGRSWEQVRPEQPQDETPDNATFPGRFEPLTVEADRATVLLAPDNAAASLENLLASADRSIRIEQVSISRDGVLFPATVAAARRGVTVQILLSSAWYVERDNRQLAERIRSTADREGLPISVRLVEPRSRFEHIHVKGVIVDGTHAVVGSINWNRNALFENREVAVIIADPAVARFYTRLFRADWRGAAWRLPWAIIGAMAGCVGLAILIGSWTIEFTE